MRKQLLIFGGAAVFFFTVLFAFGSVVDAGVGETHCKLGVSAVERGEVDLQNKSQADCVLVLKMTRRYSLFGGMGFYTVWNEAPLKKPATEFFADLKAGKTVFPADKVDGCVSGMMQVLTANAHIVIADAKSKNQDVITVFCSERIGA